MLGIDLTQGKGKVKGASGRVRNGYSVGNVFVETQGGQRVQECVRHELARDGARGFGFGKGCLGVVLMTQDGCRQVGIGKIGVGKVMVMTASWIALSSHSMSQCDQRCVIPRKTTKVCEGALSPTNLLREILCRAH